MKLVINIPDKAYELLKSKTELDNIAESIIANGTSLPKGHGRLGDLDELEQRINAFVEHDANITDEYTVIRQRFIVEGIRQTPTIIEADKQKGSAE